MGAVKNKETKRGGKEICLSMDGLHVYAVGFTRLSRYLEKKIYFYPSTAEDRARLSENP